MYPLRNKQQRRSTRLKIKLPQKKPTEKAAAPQKTAPKKRKTTSSSACVPIKTTKKLKQDNKPRARTSRKDTNLIGPDPADKNQTLSQKTLNKELERITNFGTYGWDDKATALIDPCQFMKKHEKLKCTVVADFCACLSTYGNDKWSNLLKEVPMMIADGTTQKVPLFFKLCLGEPDNTKVGIANKALIDWNIVTKKKIGQKGCEWYKPATQNQRIRTFFGEVRKKYGWKLKQNDFNYCSMLNPMLEHIYKARRNQYKMLQYRLPMPTRIPSTRCHRLIWRNSTKTIQSNT